MLILTGMRHNQSGNYLTYKELRDAADKFNVPVTPLMKVEYSKDYDTAGQLLTRVKDAVNLEGYILAFENGEMYKMKCQWYVDRSKKVRLKRTTSSIVRFLRPYSRFRLQIAGNFSGQEKELWALILDQKIDDLAESLGYGEFHLARMRLTILLPPPPSEKRRLKLEEYGMKLWQALERSANRISEVVEEAKKRELDRRDFVTEIQQRAEKGDDKMITKDLLGIYYRVYEGHKALAELVEFVKRAINNKHKLDKVRHLVAEGIKINLS